MSQLKINIKEPLCTILKDKNFDHFTILQLRNSFLLKLKNKITKKEARLFVYQQILSLVKKGLLSKNETTNSRNTTYAKTTLFFEANIISKESQPKQSLNKTDHNLLTNKEILSDEPVNKIKSELKTHKVDLLSSIAESEEYIQLIKAFPTAKYHLQSQYHQSFEQSSKLLGKIKALKTLLHFVETQKA